MTEHRPGVTVLDDPLAQFDRLLRDIQVALAPEREPAPPAPSAPPTPRPQPESARGRMGPLAEILERARRQPSEAAPEPEPDESDGAAEPPVPPEPPGPEKPERPEQPEQPAQPESHWEDLAQQLSALGDLRSSLEELRASLGELLAGYQGALIRALAGPPAPPVPAPPPGPAPAPPPGGHTVGHEFTIVAGPFVRLEAVRAFERALLDLPGIDQVAIRGYEGADRAIVDVRIAERNS